MPTVLLGSISQIEKKKPIKLNIRSLFNNIFKSLFKEGGLIFILQIFKKVEDSITSKCCKKSIFECNLCLNKFLESSKEIKIDFKKYAFITIASSDNPRMLIAISLFIYNGFNLYGNIEYCSKEFIEILNGLKDSNFRRIKRYYYGNSLRYEDFEYNDIFNLFKSKDELISMLLHYYVCIKLCYKEKGEPLITNYKNYLREYVSMIRNDDEMNRNDKSTPYNFIEDLYNLLDRRRDIFLNTTFKTLLQDYCNKLL